MNSKLLTLVPLAVIVAGCAAPLSDTAADLVGRSARHVVESVGPPHWVRTDSGEIVWEYYWYRSTEPETSGATVVPPRDTLAGAARWQGLDRHRPMEGVLVLTLEGRRVVDIEEVPFAKSVPVDELKLDAVRPGAPEEEE